MWRPWWIAVLVSVGLHLLLAAVLLLLVRSKPADPGANPAGTVELLMVEKRGSGPLVPPAKSQSEASADASPSPPVTAPPTRPFNPPAPAPASPPSVPDAAGEPMPPAAAEAPRQEAPVFNLDGTDSDSNAVALGSQVIPASPDDRFRNRPPAYPYDAAARGERGTVVVVVHVAENGVSTGADVARTSGVASLDRAALDAVRKWRFRPAMKNGRAVPFDMPMRFIFESE